MLSGKWLIRWLRCKVWLLDVRDRQLRRICAAAPDGLPTSPGYHFWRCGLARGHAGWHRTGNYDWLDAEGEMRGGSVYSPEKSFTHSPHRPAGVRSKRQRQLRELWDAEQDKLRAIKRVRDVG